MLPPEEPAHGRSSAQVLVITDDDMVPDHGLTVDPAPTANPAAGADAANSTGGAVASPAEAGSGGAPSQIGARESGRLAAGQPPTAGGPFNARTQDTEPDDDE
jgi:hypothetical protein